MKCYNFQQVILGIIMDYCDEYHSFTLISFTTRGKENILFNRSVLLLIRQSERLKMW